MLIAILILVSISLLLSVLLIVLCGTAIFEVRKVYRLATEENPEAATAQANQERIVTAYLVHLDKHLGFQNTCLQNLLVPAAYTLQKSAEECCSGDDYASATNMQKIMIRMQQLSEMDINSDLACRVKTD